MTFASRCAPPSRIATAERAQPEDPVSQYARTVLNDVRNAVDAHRELPPPNAERPKMELTRPTIEAKTLAIPSPVAGEDELRLAVEAVRRELLERPSAPLASASCPPPKPGRLLPAARLRPADAPFGSGR